MSKKSFDSVLKKCREIHGNFYEYIENTYVDIDTVFMVICPIHGRFDVKPKNHYSPSKHQGCSKCTIENERKRIEKKWIDIILNETDNYPNLVSYVDSKTKITLLCNEHGEFEKLPETIREGCPTCNLIQRGIEHRVTKEEFIRRATECHNDLYQYDNIKYTKFTEYVYDIYCTEHNGYFDALGSNHVRYKCNVCHQTTTKTLSEFILEANRVHNNSYTYENVIYINNETKVEITCPTHGTFWQTPSSHSKQQAGCPSCSSSKGEKFILSNLIDNNINYIVQYTHPECINKQRLRFDFYLPDYDVYIEFDGIQHFEEIKFFGSHKNLIEVQKRDKIKDEFCSQNGRRLFRIRYDSDWDLEMYKILKELNK